MMRRESRPTTEAAIPEKMADGPLPTVPQTPDADEIAAHIDGTFVVLVHTTGGRYRRRCFLTVKAAEAAVLRATDAGHNAVVVLAELKPVYRLIGGDRR